MVLTAKHPVLMVYVMVTAPASTPVTTPVVPSIAAIDGLLLLHVPPPVPCVIVTVYVLHTLAGPLIADGVLTVTTAVV